MSPAVALIGEEGLTHRVLISSITGPHGVGEQGHAQCLGCAWVSVSVLVKLAQDGGSEHVRAANAPVT